MNLRNLRIPYVILASLVTAVLLFGGQFIHQRFRKDNPMRAAMLAEPGVRDFSIRKTGQGLTLELEIGPVGDLRNAVENSIRTAESYGKGPFVQIRIQDEAGRDLPDMFYHMHFALEEAAVRGNFSEMKEEMDKLSDQFGLDQIRVQITDRHLYVQLHKDNAYLYRIIDRPSTIASTGTVSTGGGVW